MLNNIIRHWHFSFRTRCALAACCPHAVARIYEIVKFFHIIFQISLCRHNVFSLILLPLSVSVRLFLCLSLDLIHRLRRCSLSLSRSAFVATFKTRPKTLLSLFMNAQNGILMLFWDAHNFIFLIFFWGWSTAFSVSFSHAHDARSQPNFMWATWIWAFIAGRKRTKYACVRVCVEIAFHVSANELRVRIAWMLTSSSSSFSLFFSLVLCVIVRVFVSFIRSCVGYTLVCTSNTKCVPPKHSIQFQWTRFSDAND